MSEDALRQTIAMAIYDATHFAEGETHPMRRSHEIADRILFKVGQKHSFKCKDCGLEHAIDASGTWRALKPE